MSFFWSAVIFILFCLFFYAILLLLIGVFRMLVFVGNKEPKGVARVWGSFFFLFHQNKIDISHKKLLLVSLSITVLVFLIMMLVNV